MSKTFLTLNRIESLEISNKTIANANVLQQTANYGAGNKNFGVATSLMILSTEEVIKAQILFFQGLGIQIQRIKGANKLFTNHKEKHQFSSLLQYTKILEGFIKAWNYQPTERRYNTGVRLMDSILDRIQEFINIIEPITLISKSIEEIRDNIEWLEKANDLKNMGFYVDYKSEIQLPESISIDTFQKASSINDESFNLYRIIRISYEKITDSESKSILIKSINDDLLPQIEDYLKPRIKV